MNKGLLSLICLMMLCACDKKNKEPIVGERMTIFADISSIKVDQPHTKIVLPNAVDNRDWAVAGGTPNHVMPVSALDAHMKQVWQFDCGVGTSSTTRILNGPIVADDTVFVMDAVGTVSAVSIADGKPVWQTNIASDSTSMQPFGGGLAYDNGLIFVASAAAEVLAIDAKTGDIRWRQKIVAPVRSAPTVYGDHVYIVTINNHLEALNVHTGEFVWSHSGTIEVAGLLGGASPAFSNGVVIVPYTSGEIFALQAENGYPLWSESLGSVHILDSVAALSHIKARPTIHRNRVFLISHGGRMSALDIRNGNTAWSREIAGIRSPAICDDYIFLITTDSQLICIEQEQGQVLWSKHLYAQNRPNDDKENVLWAGPILTEQGLILTGSNGQMVICSPQTGEVNKVLEFNSSLSLSPIIAQKTLLLLNDNAELIAYR